MNMILNKSRRLGLAVLMSTTAIGAGVAAKPVQAQSAAFVVLDIPAQPLGSALAAYSQVTGVDIAYGAALPNTRSVRVSGRMSSEEGLSRLLAGTGLTYRATGAGTVRLEAAPQAADGVIQLGAVRVEGATTGGGQSGGNGGRRLGRNGRQRLYDAGFGQRDLAGHAGSLSGNVAGRHAQERARRAVRRVAQQR